MHLHLEAKNRSNVGVHLKFPSLPWPLLVADRIDTSRKKCPLGASTSFYALKEGQRWI